MGSVKDDEKSNEGSLITAFEIGKSECDKHKSDVNKCTNPYEKYSEEWRAWNRGWNDDFYKYYCIIF